MNFLLTLLSQITAPALTIAVLAYLGRAIIDNSASKARAEYVDELERGAFEHSTSFAIMHQRRAEVIAALYILFVDAEDKAKAYLDPRNRPKTKEMADVAYSGLIPLKHYFDRHRIYLSADLCTAATKLFDAMHYPIWLVAQHTQQIPPHEQDARYDSAETIKQFTTFSFAVDELRPALETEFRLVIGSETKNNPHTVMKP